MPMRPCRGSIRLERGGRAGEASVHYHDDAWAKPSRYLSLSQCEPGRNTIIFSVFSSELTERGRQRQGMGSYLASERAGGRRRWNKEKKERKQKPLHSTCGCGCVQPCTQARSGMGAGRPAGSERNRSPRGRGAGAGMAPKVKSHTGAR
ncbi:hypothetical protein SEVIR_5G140850v4 [Setaria viridis]